MSDSYAFFLGCFTPSRVLALELSTRKVFEVLGIKLLDIEGASCCGAIHTEGLDNTSWQALAARNICLAEEMEKDILTPCNGCVETLDVTNNALKNNKELRGKINEILKDVGREFKGTIEVYHVLDVLARDEVVEKIRKSMKTSLEGIVAATHYGCHVLRPSEIRQLDDPFEPKVLDRLLEVTGAHSVSYRGKMQCCGSPLRGIDDGLALKMARTKIRAVRDSGANCIVTICPTCFLQYDMGQIELRMKLGEEHNIPVFHYQQLLGLALGINHQKLGFETHKIKVDGLLKELGLVESE